MRGRFGETNWRWYAGELLFRDAIQKRLLIAFADMDKTKPCYVPDDVEFELLEADQWPGYAGSYGPGRFRLPERYRRVTAVEELEALRLRRILAAEKREAARRRRPKAYAGKAKAAAPRRLYPPLAEPLGLFAHLPMHRKP